ncbi:acyl-CoA N-acyltransferase [Mycena belliarum]|uniref:Acyl-CoA N-acyltransferase n=1 Tax=Mycena belliarum TaxID=1033014 RepID=A0AAD6UEI7_9AGAR|nr:acyl-CoA N-acyltransferase [Mycena belliae]
MTPPFNIFWFPIPAQLENDRVKLVPFIPSEHADPLFAGFQAHDTLFAYLLWGPFASAEDLLTTLVDRVTADPASLLFAVFHKKAQGGPALAGIIGLFETSPESLATELAFLITLPQFQRTHITSNAIGLLLRWTLDTPAAGGLGLRRVAWKANARNTKSVRAAERMGFRKEGVLRWESVLPAWKTEVANGGGVREGDPVPGGLGRDTVLLSVCWDDWEGGVGESVKAIMERTS